MKKVFSKKLVWKGLSFYDLCCVIPGIGVVFGCEVLATLAFYLKKAPFLQWSLY
tara:strand:- start:493 stop:654 length:162 start_codon:yes stop_codon:yes gene_type:complete